MVDLAVPQWQKARKIDQWRAHVPGINAVAGMHDVFQISYPNSFLRDVFNLPGMPIAAALTYGGFFGAPLTVMIPQQIIYFSTSPAFNYDMRRDK